MPFTSAELAQLAQVRRLAETGEAARIRATSGTSASAAAAAIGKTHVTVLRWEKGQRRPSGRAALRYLKLLRALERAGRR
jgi:DNA-binding transcriptional regulator YiaG